MKKLNIVLFEPEIPENTGNIARSCVGFNATLHLIKPYGFILNQNRVKRAGLDYWEFLSLKEYDNWEDFEKQNNLTPKSNVWLFTKFANVDLGKTNFKVDNNEKTFLVFGKETKGLPQQIKDKYVNHTKINMNENIRSFNLSNSVAIALYEFHRQTNFEFMK